MRLIYALQGDLRELLKAKMLNAERAITAGIREAADGLKTALRLQITSAELGSCLANTWRGEVYPKGQPSIGAAGFVSTRLNASTLAYGQVREIRERARLDLALLAEALAQIALRVATSGSAHTDVREPIDHVTNVRHKTSSYMPT